MKINIAEFAICHSHMNVRDSKEVPFNTDLTLKGLEIDIPVDEAIESLKNGGADIAKQFLGIIAEDCKGQKELRRMEAEARLAAEKNEAERLRLAKKANQQ